MKRLERVARKGGEASHGSERGFASMSEDERKRIPSKGGQK
jgi:hypothetical protein